MTRETSLTNIDDLFDLDFDDPLPVFTTKKRKVIGLDDLFNDHKEQEKSRKKISKAAKANKYCESDEDDANETEKKLTKTLHSFKQTIQEVDGQEVASIENLKTDMTVSWGLEGFGAQQRPPSQLVAPELGSSLLSQISMSNKFSVLMDGCSQIGETFCRGLLLDGWLSKLIINLGYVEVSVAKWTLNLMLYSPEESVVTSACDFWCSILLCDKVHGAVVNNEWLPGFMELNEALECFGFQLHSPTNKLAAGDSSSDSDCKGPPANIRAWIKFASACCQVRSKYVILSTLEAQELVATVVCFFLDRKLLGLTSALHDCLLLGINYFQECEWLSSCEKVTKSIADRVPRDLNCLRVVECISGIDSRSKQLRSALASQFLKSSFTEISDAKNILKLLLSKNLKDKCCDLFKIYIYFVLTENWLTYSSELELDVKELWDCIIRKCSSQISNTDFRSCAQELRNRASYLVQSDSSYNK